MSLAPLALPLLSKADFEPFLNERFRTANTEPSVELTLAEVRPLRAYPGPGREQPFALTFRGPLDKALPQALYGLEVAPGTAFEIFLVPVGIDADARRYEAVFN